ncbi:MAG TPA: hypothetical protein VEO95_01380 [Chthoniobacteraceae bacterium]|nr:hypothetical protein [Chthoniobacteraceae bacterium]
MKSRTLPGFALVAVALAAGLSPQATRGQIAADDLVLAQLIDEVSKQQAQVIDNQTKIDEKLATIAENLRVARIFVGRGGGKAPATAQ